MTDPDSLADCCPYPVINAAYVPVVVDADTVELRVGPWSGSAFTIRDEDGDGIVADLIDRLDATTHVTDVLDAFETDERGEVAGLLASLRERNVVVDAAESGADPDLLGGYMTASPRLDPDERDRVRAASVLVVTDGSVGTAVVRDLLEVGVGELAVIALDGIDRSLPENPAVVRRGRSELPAAVDSADCVACCLSAPRPDLLDALNERAHEVSTPVTYGAVTGIDGRVGPTVLPGESSCFECFRRRRASNVGDGDRFSLFRRQAADRDRASVSGVPAFGRVVGGYVTLEVINQLSRGVAMTTGRALTIDFADYTRSVDEVLPVPRCPVCGVSEGSTPSCDRFQTLEDDFGGGDGD